MNPDTSTAYNAGVIVGMLVVGSVCIGGFVFFIIALIKAFTKRTPGWIITAAVMGVISLLLLASIVASAVAGVARATSGISKATKVLVTKDGRHQITVPASWSSMPELNAEAGIAAASVLREQYLIVILEERSEVEVGLVSYMEYTSDRMASLLKSSSQGKLTQLSIGGFPAQQRRITGQTEGVNLAYLHTCVATNEHLVQLIGWTLAGREDTAFPVLEKVVTSFTPTQSAPPTNDKQAPPADRIRQLVSEQLGAERAAIKDDSRLTEDLGADDLDLVELVMAVEDEFNVEVPDDDAQAWKSPGDIIRWVESHPRKN
jgi:acyl carrier protein